MQSQSFQKLKIEYIYIDIYIWNFQFSKVFLFRRTSDLFGFLKFLISKAIKYFSNWCENISSWNYVQEVTEVSLHILIYVLFTLSHNSCGVKFKVEKQV